MANLSRLELVGTSLVDCLQVGLERATQDFGYTMAQILVGLNWCVFSYAAAQIHFCDWSTSIPSQWKVLHEFAHDFFYEVHSSCKNEHFSDWDLG